jgi:Icc-related predicted phosphoesterase
MRVAAIYDIHGNLPALEVVVQEIRQGEVGLIIVGGDVLPGPLPCETLACLLNIGIPVQFIYGNGEVAVLEQMAQRTIRRPGAVSTDHTLDGSAASSRRRAVVSWLA